MFALLTSNYSREKGRRALSLFSSSPNVLLISCRNRTESAHDNLRQMKSGGENYFQERETGCLWDVRKREKDREGRQKIKFTKSRCRRVVRKRLETNFRRRNASRDGRPVRLTSRAPRFAERPTTTTESNYRDSQQNTVDTGTGRKGSRSKLRTSRTMAGQKRAPFRP